MFWKTLTGGTALIGAAALLTLPFARGTDGAPAAFEPVIDAVACRPGDRANGALKTYLAAARARTEIGPFDRQVLEPGGNATADAPLIDGLGTRYGLAQVYERRGDSRAAAAAKRRFDAAWAGSWNAPDLARL